MIVCRREAGIEFEGALEFATRVGVIAEMVEGHGQAEVGVGGFGIEIECVTVLVVRSGGAALGKSCVALVADVARFTFDGEFFL